MSSPIFRRQGFFDTAETAQLLSGLNSARLERTQVLSSGQQQRILDEQARKTFRLSVSEVTQARVSYALMTLKPELEAYFGLELQACQPLHFLAYQPGDFFRRHTDVIPAPHKLARVRHLSVLMFLNAPPDYSGGELVFYPDPDSAELCPALAGDLIAFRPDCLHEVRPVLSGLRYTIVSWFY